MPGACRRACCRRRCGRQDEAADCLSDGIAPGALAAVEADIRSPRSRSRNAEDGRSPSRRWHVTTAARKRARRLCGFRTIVTVKDIALANQEGFRPVDPKRYTTPAWRPTREGRERHRPRDPRRGVRPRNPRGRHHDLSAALRAGELRRDERAPSGQGFPPDPAAALASMGGRAGRGVRRVRRLAARAILSAVRREGLARDGQSRGDGDARQRRRARRLDARQDRDRGTDAAAFPTASTPTRSTLPVERRATV